MKRPPPADDEPDAEEAPPDDPRDYDADHYIRILREQFASRLARALTPDDFAAVFADPDQLSLFVRSLDTARPVLTAVYESHVAAEDE